MTRNGNRNYPPKEPPVTRGSSFIPICRPGQQVLYYDTDSVIYKWSAGLPKITTGDMKNEVEGDYIKEFVSGGPKNYGYRTWKEKVECKVRGFTLNVRGKETLNFDSMKKMKAGVMPWNEWKNLRDGRARQETRAQELHQAAGVPEGPCGLPELNKFQRYLSPHYQIKVLSRHHPFKVVIEYL